MLTADCNAPPQLLAGEFARSLTPYADCVEKYGGSRMTKGTVRDVYIKYLEHNPSAAPRFHAWVDPTAPSPSPPLSEPSWAHVVPGSEPAPSSSRSSASAKKPCTARKPFYLTPVQREKVQLDKDKLLTSC